ncbi:MAG: bifunctional cobalt-precorrin 5A hydrolase/precorrin-3B C(17)-methyltransferase [Nitrospirae bacterium]|nr:bifunctional cobalt-precorrin 5A hydrolase/precorrin-3B C(17)-methyltransferase [Nitrospirota bacterium]
MNSGSSPAILYITGKGLGLAQKLAGLYPGARILKFMPGIVPELWGRHRTLIFVMAAGIAVRSISRFVKDKKTDPAVVVLDEKGRFAVSLLSGHLGGANERAREIAGFLGGEAVITTSSDVNDVVPIDLWARDNELAIEDWRLVSGVGTRLLDKGALHVYTETVNELPAGFVRVFGPEEADICITNRSDVPRALSAASACERPLFLRPRNLVIGLGCNSGTSREEIDAAVRKTLDECNLSFLSVRSVATIDRKAAEPGLVAFAADHGLPVVVFSAGELNGVKGVKKSEAALKATGANAVAEPAALLAARDGVLREGKRKIGNVTVAVAEDKRNKRTKNMKQGRKGMIYIVGTGPGDSGHITPYARKAITGSDVLVGYGTYMDLIRDLTVGKEVFSTGMTQEVDRCRKAVELALQGKTVSVISGGDPGIYAMAGLVFEVLKNSGESSVKGKRSGNKEASRVRPQRPGTNSSQIGVEVVPGISALNACAARLGAPLMHDFASISLSDRLTPWELIEKRLDAAAMADFVIALYNPKSKGRAGRIREARDIILRHRSAKTPVGIVRAAMREGEHVVVTDIEKMLDHEIDMQTTVLVGNAQTFVWNGRMITPRGYEKKFRT